YVPGPEEPEQAPPSPVYIPYVLEPVYPEYIPPQDDVLPAEEQPLPAAASPTAASPTAASPTADSPGYIPESYPDEDPEDDDEDSEEDPTDYPADHDDEEEGEGSSRDDANEEDEEQDKNDNDEEEEHPASADSILPLPALRVTARISFRPQPSTLFFTKEEAERFLAMPIPPPSLLTLLSSLLPQIPSPLLLASPPILPIPLPAASPPLQLLSFDHRTDRPEVTLPPRKRLNIVHGPGYEAGESSVAAAVRPMEGRKADYGFDLRDVVEEEALTTLEGVNTRVTEFAAVYDFMKANGCYLSCDLKKMASKKAAPSGTGVRRTERWFERMETGFHISNCLAENQIKFATCTLFADKYCPRNEMKKIETEFWNLEVQGTVVT
nr:hypothetical protein [Tanacetum cinerariifolium]